MNKIHFIRSKGVILFVLLVMLLFAGMLILQLDEDNYLMQLMVRQVDAMFIRRHALDATFRQLSAGSGQSKLCHSAAYYPSELIAFWLTFPSCQKIVDGIAVDYAFYMYEPDEVEDDPEKEVQAFYLQYTLRAGEIWLRVVTNKETGEIVSYLYFSS